MAHAPQLRKSLRAWAGRGTFVARTRNPADCQNGVKAASGLQQGDRSVSLSTKFGTEEVTMPALNIKFTDAELAALRRCAAAEGRPVTRLAHDILVLSTTRANHNELVMGAAAEVTSLSRDLLRRLAGR
jgi:hypothetical protein